MFASIKLLSMMALAFTATAAPIAKRVDANGPGIILTNKGTIPQQYFFYNNIWNGVGTAGANFDHPEANAPTLQPGQTTFVPLDKSFKGRVQRGTEMPATFVEFQLAAEDGYAHGDVSLHAGYDGAATIASLTNSQVGGFMIDLLPGAPDAALGRSYGALAPKNGKNTLAATMGSWAALANDAVVQWYVAKGLKQENVYMYNDNILPIPKLVNGVLQTFTSGEGTNDISSTNNQFHVYFF